VENKYILHEKNKNTNVICMTHENIASNIQSIPLFTSRTVIVLLLNFKNGFDLVPYSNFHVTLFTFRAAFW